MNAQDLREQSIEQLERLLGEKQEELRTLRFKVREGQLKGVRQIREVRALIARIHTLISERTQQPVA